MGWFPTINHSSDRKRRLWSWSNTSRYMFSDNPVYFNDYGPHAIPKIWIHWWLDQLTPNGCLIWGVPFKDQIITIQGHKPANKSWFVTPGLTLYTKCWICQEFSILLDNRCQHHMFGYDNLLTQKRHGLEHLRICYRLTKITSSWMFILILP